MRKRWQRSHTWLNFYFYIDGQLAYALIEAIKLGRRPPMHWKVPERGGEDAMEVRFGRVEDGGVNEERPPRVRLGRAFGYIGTIPSLAWGSKRRHRGTTVDVTQERCSLSQNWQKVLTYMPLLLLDSSTILLLFSLHSFIFEHNTKIKYCQP